MKKIFEFIIDNWLLIGPVIYEIVARVWPTRWNVSMLDNIWKIINMLIPNKRVESMSDQGLGTNARGEVVNTVRVKSKQHILHALLILCLFSSAELIAQPSYYMRQLRFATGVQNSVDTTADLGHQGFVWYDFTTKRYRANFGGVNKFFGESGGTDFWPLNTTATQTGFTSITTSGGQVMTFGDSEFTGGWTLNNSAAGDFFVLRNTGFTSSGTDFTFSPGNATFNFLANALTGGAANESVVNFNLGANDPLSLSEGDFWYDQTANVFKGRAGVTTFTFGSGTIDGTMVLNRVPFGLDNNTLTTDASFTYTTGGPLTLGTVGISSLVLSQSTQAINGSNHNGSMIYGYSSNGVNNGGDLIFSAGNVTGVTTPTGGNMTFSTGGQSANNTTAGSFNFNIGHRNGTGAAGKFIVQSPSTAEGLDFFTLSQFAAGVDDPIVNFRQDAVTTTDATVTTINTVAIPASTTVMIQATIAARRTGGAAGTAEDGAGYIIAAVFKNVAGTATLIGTVSAIFTAESQAGFNATMVGSGANALIQVTGALNNNISWHLSECKIIPISTL